MITTGGLPWWLIVLIVVIAIFGKRKSKYYECNPLAIISLIITLVSSAYSIYQAKKAKAKAKAAAEARKGFELPVEGESIHVPLVYGRAKIGGARTYHNTSSDFVYVTPNSDKEFLAGLTAAQRINPKFKASYRVNARAAPTDVIYDVTQGGTLLNQSLTGKKNSFLFFQQVFCYGPINTVHDLVIEESKYLDDPSMGTDLYVTEQNTIEGALRVDAHYDGGVADSIIAANFPERSKATFDNMAYISGVARLDRENPQFSGTPIIQGLIEGKLVKKLSGGSLTAETYSNASPWCLLDYLMNPIYGKGLPLSKIDVASFEAAGNLAETIVQSNMLTYGKIWQPTDGSRNVTLRDIPLYECNIIIDTAKPIRENIESILATMGDTRLVWSGGKYKLLMQYPATNDDIDYDLELDDSNISLDEDIEIKWPSASDRLNYCTVRFNNEAINFKEDAVSWPPKLGPAVETQTSLVGVGGFYYGFGSSNKGWDDDKSGGRLLNNLSVWNGNLPSTSIEYHFLITPENYGSCTLEFTMDDEGTVDIEDVLTSTVLYSFSHSDWKTASSHSITLGHPTEDRVYKITLTGADLSGEASEDDGSKTKGRGIAARISKGNLILWTTREPAYTAFEEISLNNAVYRTMLAEDNGMELETEIFAEGITDRHHALAKAEELVRTSRGAANLKLTYVVRDIIAEPGDFVKISSTTLNLSPIYTRVTEAKMNANWTCELSLSMFDYSFLAWNVKDDDYITPPQLYNFQIPAPVELLYTASTGGIVGSSGLLSWSASGFVEVDAYIVLAHVQGDAVDSNNYPIFKEIGRTNQTFFQLPQINGQYAFFGVRTLSKSGRYSSITYLGTDINDSDEYIINAIDLSHTYSRFVKITATPQLFTKLSSTGVTAPTTITLNANYSGIATPHYDWYIDDVFVTGNDISSLVLDQFTDVDHKRIKLVMYDESNYQDSIEDTLDIKFQELIVTNVQEVKLYIRTTSEPVVPSGTLTYTFADESFTGDLESWSTTIPAGTDPLYTIKAVAKSTTPTANILTTDWSGVALISAEGIEAVTLVLSRPSVNLPKYSSGGVADFSRANGQLSVLRGGVNITDLATLSVTSSTHSVGTLDPPTTSLPWIDLNNAIFPDATSVDIETATYADIVSEHFILGDMQLQLVIPDSAGDISLGFVLPGDVHGPDPSYTVMSYEMYITSENSIDFYSDGGGASGIGTVAPGDIVAIQRIDNVIKCIINGVVVYTEAVAADYEQLHGAVSIWSGGPGRLISGLSLSGDIYQVYNAASSLVFSVIDAFKNPSSTLAYVGTNFSSTQPFEIEATIDSAYAGTGKIEIAVALTGTPGSEPTWDARLRVYDGNLDGPIGSISETATAGDILKIRVEAGDVKYYKNGVLLVTDVGVFDPGDELYGYVNIYAQADIGVENVLITGEFSADGALSPIGGSTEVEDVTGTINTAIDTPVSGHPKGYYEVTGMNVDSGELIIHAVIGGDEYTIPFVISVYDVGYEIVDTLPVTNLYLDRIVYLNSDGKLYRYNGTTWDNNIGNAPIAGLIQAHQIAAGAVTAAKINVTNLAAINIHTGSLTVDDELILDDTGSIHTTGKTGYSSDVAGLWLGYDTDAYKFYIGDDVNHLKWDGANLILTGKIIGTANIADGAITTSETTSVNHGDGTEFDTAFTGTYAEVNSLYRVDIDLGSETGVLKNVTLSFLMVAERDGGDDDNICLQFKDLTTGVLLGVEAYNIQMHSGYRLYWYSQTFTSLGTGVHTYTLMGRTIVDGSPFIKSAQTTAQVFKK